MSVSLYKVRKWAKMLTGKSISHVSQGVGQIYSKSTTKGYYNDLTEKVTKRALEVGEIPISNVDTGEKIYFSIEIFQYGLGAFDLYLMDQNYDMLKNVISCANWAVENQQPDGSWVTFTYENPEHPYSSMAQSEGISLLLRANLATGEKKYLDAAVSAKNFMLRPISEGGTTEYRGEDVCFFECTHDPLILNGWIFSIWGLYDYTKCIEDPEAEVVLHKTLESLKKKIPEFDIGYWSNYEEGGKRICSPFYHKLHIAQLRAMYDLFGDEIYKTYADKWEGYQNKFWNPKVAFVKKAMQKIFE